MPKGKRSTRAPFTAALEAANQRLAKAIEERARCQNKLAMLNAEIPSLERSIVVLGGHLEKKPIQPAGSIAEHLQNAPTWQEPDMQGVGVAGSTPVQGTPELPNLGNDEEWK